MEAAESGGSGGPEGGGGAPDGGHGAGECDGHILGLGRRADRKAHRVHVIIQAEIGTQWGREGHLYCGHGGAHHGDGEHDKEGRGEVLHSGDDDDDDDFFWINTFFLLHISFIDVCSNLSTSL